MNHVRLVKVNACTFYRCVVDLIHNYPTSKNKKSIILFVCVKCICILNAYGDYCNFKLFRLINSSNDSDHLGGFLAQFERC